MVTLIMNMASKLSLAAHTVDGLYSSVVVSCVIQT